MQRYIKYPTWRVPMPLNFRTAPLQPPRYAPPSPSCPCEASGASPVVVQQASADLLHASVGSYLMLRALVPYDTCPRNISHVLTYRMIRATNVAPGLSRWARQSVANDREQPVGAALVVLMGRYAGGRHRPCAMDGTTGSAGALSRGSRHGSAVGLSLPRSRAGCLCAWQQDGA